MKFFLFIVLYACSISSSAQKTVDVTTNDINALSTSFFNVVGGEPFVLAKFTKLVEGTPYFKEEWMKGNIIINGEKEYTGIYLKLDLFDNEVHYQDPKGIEMIATGLVQKIILFDTAAQQVFNFVNGVYIQANSRVKGWYQLLVNGKASLFKQINKQLRENKPYGSATIEQSIISSSHYYILYNGIFTEIKKIRDLPGILNDKKEEVVQYIKNLSGKSDDDFENVINYFNGLK